MEGDLQMESFPILRENGFEPGDDKFVNKAIQHILSTNLCQDILTNGFVLELYTLVQQSKLNSNSGLYKTRDRATGGRSKIRMNLSLGVRFCGHRTLLLDRNAASWRGINKQTVYILSFKTNLNMDVFQIVFSVFSLIRVSAYSQAWAIRESSK